MNGLWWDEVPVSTVKVKPYAFWLEPTYLPGLEEARRFPVDMMTYKDMIDAKIAGDNLVCDTECYSNYWLCAFKSLSTGKVAYVEMIGDNELDRLKLQWFIDNFTIVTFNGIHYDLPMIQLAAAGLNTATLKWCSDEIIIGTSTRYQLYKRFKAKKLDFRHMDIKEVCPLDHSLKKYGSRIHTRKMQDLPFAPETKLSDDQIAIVRFYCCNDLAVTAELFDGLIDQIKLRVEMSKKYSVDLRSKSDAQIAEAVISHELMRLTGIKAEKPTIPVGTTFRYKAPNFIQFQTPYMKELLTRITSHDYVVNEKGSINLPDFLKGLKINLGSSSFTMGIGGLHSNEKKQVKRAIKGVKFLRDADVASMYPSIILNLRLFPQHLGAAFLEVYQSIVDRRLEAKKMQKACKKAGDKDGEATWKVINESLKIVINGSFGKLGSKYSVFYSPDLMITVTLTGQLCLLMLIEQLELHGIKVVSANTDGIVCEFTTEQEWLYKEICAWWEKTTRFELEFADYEALYSRDVNSYIAMKPGSSVKCKGAYSNPWADGDISEQLKKSPTGTICNEAVVAYLLHGTPLLETIENCTDIKKFAFVKEVKGGGFKGEEMLGKVVRWIYRLGETGQISYNSSGNKVSGSDGASPMMQLFDNVPEDIDYQRYVEIAAGMLADLGHEDFVGVSVSAWNNLACNDEYYVSHKGEGFSWAA